MIEAAIPCGWKFAEIDQLCDLINGRAFKPTDWGNDGLPIIRIQNLNNQDASFNHCAGEVEEKHLVKNGDLLFAWSGTPGTSFGAHVWYGGDAVLNQHIFKIAFPEELIDKHFFRFAINQKLDELISSAQGGVGLRHVTKGIFEKTVLVFPPLAEQQQIVKQLDALLTQVDKCKTRLGSITAVLKRFRQSTLSAAVSGKLTEQWRVGNAMPLASWVTKRLKEISSDVTYGYTAKSTVREVGPKMLRITDIQSNYVNWVDVPFCEIEERKKETYLLKKGDLLFARTGATVGKSFLISETPPEAVFASYLIRVRCGSQNSIEYLSLFFQSTQYWSQILEFSAGIGQPNVNGTKLKELLIPIPEFAEQTEIVRRVMEILSYADQVEKRVNDALSRINHLTQSILAKAFSGELTADWRAANPGLITGENSSEALLKRIKAERVILALTTEDKKKTLKKRTGSRMKSKKIVPVIDALKATGKALSTKQLLEHSGYPSDADTQMLERFFLDIRDSLDAKQISKVRKANEDYFTLLV